MSGRGTTLYSADAPRGTGLRRRILIAGRFQASTCRVLEPLSVPVGSWKESLPRAEELSGEGVRGGCEKAWQQTKTKGTLCCRVWPRPGNGGKQNGRENRNIYCHLFAPSVPGGGRERAAASPAWWELCQAGEEAWETEEDGRGDAGPCGSSGESD